MGRIPIQTLVIIGVGCLIVAVVGVVLLTTGEDGCPTDEEAAFIQSVEMGMAEIDEF